LSLCFVRTRQLIHHGVVAGIVRARLQETFVELDGLLQLHALDARVDAGGPRGLVDFDLQVAEPARRLGAHLLVLRLQLQEAAVLFDRLLWLHVGRRIGRDLHFAALQILDRARRLLGRCFLIRSGGRRRIGTEGTDAGERRDQNVAGQRVASAHRAAPLVLLLDARS
jgi:hypothetical protein